MRSLHDLLASSIPLRLFAVIGLGYFLGSLKLRGFSLGLILGVALGMVPIPFPGGQYLQLGFAAQVLVGL